MAVIGVHEILLVPSLKGGQAAIGRELDKAAGPAGERAGRSMGSRLGGALKVGALAAGATAVAGLGMAISKGLGRLTAIENARAKLSGLGNDAQTVEKIMTNALASVKGTAFGMDEAATVAASMVASGIKPGQELEGVLRLVGDAATIAGTDLSSMGAVWGKVAASGKIQGDTLAQLADMGIPIVQMLSKELGVSAEETYKLASKGEVNFEHFRAAMENGLGGAAKASGETLQGAMKNAGAAIGRFGANLMTGVYPHIKDFFNGFMAFMEPMEAQAKVLGEAMGVFLGKVTDGMTGLWDLLANRDYTGKLRDVFGWEEDEGGMVDMLLSMHDAMKNALTAARDFGKAMWDAREGIGIAAGVITALLIPAMIKSATEATKSAWKHVVAWKTKRTEAVKTAWQYQVSAYAMIGHMVATSATMVATAAVHAFTWGRMGTAALVNGAKIAAGWLMAMGPLGWIIGAVAAVAAVVIMNWEHIANFTRPIWESVAGFVVTAWDAIVGAVRTGIDWVVNLAQGAWSAAVDIFGAVWQGVSDFLTAVWETSIKPLFDGIVAAWQFVAGVFNTIWLSTLKPVFDGIASVVGWLWQHIIGPTFYNIQQAWILAVDVIRYAWNNFLAPMFAAFGAIIWALWKDKVEKVFAFIGAAWGGLVNGVRDLWNGVLAPVFAAVGSFLMDVWNNVISMVFKWIGESWAVMVRGAQVIWDTVLKPVFEAVGAVLNWLWLNVVQPVFGFIGTAWGGMVNGIRDLWNGVLKPVFDALGKFIKGVWVDYIQPVFKWIGDAWGGMVNGIRDLWNNTLKPVLKAFGDFVHDTVVKRIQDGVEMIKNAWNGISKGFANTINWVLTHVWNRGIVKAFNDVATAVDSSARLKEAGLIATGDSGASKAAVGRGAHRGAQARKDGGNVHAGRPYLVGELGPEYIFPDRDGYVATARETAKMMAAGKDLPEDLSRRAAGRHPSEALAPMGGFNFGAAGDYLKDQLGIGKFLGTDQLVAGVGQLAQYAKGILDPLLAQIAGGSPFGLLAKDWAGDMAAKVIAWAKGEDDSAATAMGGGMSGAIHEGPAGSFYKPSSGVITSRYGPRWGRVHEGIDIAAGAAGAAIKAAWNGVVAKTGWNIGPGRTGIGALLNHGSRWSYYGHMRPGTLAVQPGQKVKAGQQIGWQGTTGNSTGVHLHFEEHRGKPWNSVNPGYLFRDQGGVLPPGLNAVLNNTGGNEWIFNKDQLGKLDSAVRGGSGMEVNFNGPIGYDPREITAQIDMDRKRKMHAYGIA